MRLRATAPLAVALGLSALLGACSAAGEGAVERSLVVVDASQAAVATTPPLTVPTVAASDPEPVAGAETPDVDLEDSDVGSTAIPTAAALQSDPDVGDMQEPRLDTSDPTTSPSATSAPAATAATADDAGAGDPAPAVTPIPDVAAETPPPATATVAPTPSPVPTPSPPPTSPAIPTVPAAALERSAPFVGHIVLGRAGGIELSMPVAQVELIGFHEAGHPGSTAIEEVLSGASTTVLESRSRGTAATSAADIVVPVGTEVRAPVTGTVVSAGDYILYCEHQDALVYIEPDGWPGWQVRLFHVADVAVSVGDRVVAGETRVAVSARLLPFESQVDEFTAEPSWPHVHLEVVDTSVPDTRPPGPGC